MKSTLLISLLTTGCLFVSCDKAQEAGTQAAAAAAAATPLEQGKALLAKMTDGMTKLTTALESVTDKASAETAAATIKTISDELAATGKEAQALDKTLPKEVKDELEKLGGETMEKNGAAMEAAMGKIMTNPELAAIIGPAMETFGKAMMGASEEEPTPEPTPEPGN